MPRANQLPGGLEPSPSQIQVQLECPNFSRPRRSHPRNYSTVLPFRHPKDNSKSSQIGDSPTSTTRRAKNATINTITGNKPYIPGTTDYGMDVDPEQRRLAEERISTEEGVRDAFKRWDVSDKARRKLKQPSSVAAHRDAKPIAEPFMQNDHDPREVEGTAPVFEKVEGTQLDSRPGYLAGPYKMEQTLPEIEAHDIREIPARYAFSYTLPSRVEEDQGRLSSLTTAPSSEKSGVSPQLWSEISGSSSTASTENNTLKPYQHVPEEFMSSNENNHEIFKQFIDSHHEMVRRISAAELPELDSPQGPASLLQPASQLKARKLPLEAIDEETRDAVIGNKESDAAPAPNVKGIRDEEVMGNGRAPHFPAASRQASTTLLTEKATSPMYYTSPPRVLAASGIGDDKNVYELEAPVPANIKPSRSDTAPNAVIADHTNADGLLDKVEHGVSKVVHALHEKVKKTVTFSPVNDVRLMTPSPYPSTVDNTNAVAVDTPH